MSKIEIRDVIVLERINERIFLVQDVLDNSILKMRVSGKQIIHKIIPEISENVKLIRLKGANHGRFKAR